MKVRVEVWRSALAPDLVYWRDLRAGKNAPPDSGTPGELARYLWRARGYVGQRTQRQTVRRRIRVYTFTGVPRGWTLRPAAWAYDGGGR